MTDPLSHHHSSPSPRLFLFAAVIFHLFLSALIIPPLSFTSAKLVFPLPRSPHISFPSPPLPLCIFPCPPSPSSSPPCFANSWMFTWCQPHHPFCLGLCWEDLLFSFTFYLFPYLPFPLKMELKSPVPTRARTHTHTRVRAETSHCHTRRLTKQRHAVPRHMKEHKPLVLLLLYLLLILSLHFSLSQPPTPSSFFFSCCKCGVKQICVCIFFI